MTWEYISEQYKRNNILANILKFAAAEVMLVSKVRLYCSKHAKQKNAKDKIFIPNIPYLARN